MKKLKIRNRFEAHTNRLNARYNLGKQSHELAIRAQAELSAIPAFLAISLHSELYSAYFAPLSVLDGNRGIPMTSAWLSRYECLAKDEHHGSDTSHLKNTYMKTKLEFKNQQVRETSAVASHLIACYLASRAGLKQLGILRTERTLQGDYAEWLAANLLNLKLSASTIEKHIDATDVEGKTYQIKSRIVPSISQSTSFDFRSSELTFDFLIAVFLDQAFDVLAVLRVPREAVIALSHKNASTFRFRWNRVCADDARVERLFWRDQKPSNTAFVADGGD